ncbi:MAG: hypothetical protein ACFCVF_16965 [Kineosporiaceae bacterium]
MTIALPNEQVRSCIPTRSDGLRRRAFVRFFACGRDLSHDSPDAPLPDAVVRGEEPSSSWGPWPAGDHRAGAGTARSAAGGRRPASRSA